MKRKPPYAFGTPSFGGVKKEDRGALLNVFKNGRFNPLKLIRAICEPPRRISLPQTHPASAFEHQVEEQ